MDFQRNVVTATIAPGLRQPDPEREMSQDAGGQNDRLHAQLAKTEYRIGQWAKKNLEPISLDGEVLQPLEIAKEVALHPVEAAWISDPLTIAAEHRLQFGDADIAALRNARMALAEDLPLLQQRLQEPGKVQSLSLYTPFCKQDIPLLR